MIPLDLSGRTFSHIFGANTTVTELFLRKRRIMGPCWLEAPAVAQTVPVSWCRHEYVVNDPKAVRVPSDAGPAPPLVAVSLSLKTVINPHTNANEIAAFSALIHRGVQADGQTVDGGTQYESVTGIRPLNGRPLPYNFKSFALNARMHVEECSSERLLLGVLLEKVFFSADPDVVVGHNLVGFDLDVVIHRMRDSNIEQWSRIGRLKRSVWPKLNAGLGDSQWVQKLLLAGRLLCDTQMGAKDVVREQNYSLPHLASVQLGREHFAIETEHVESYFEAADGLIQLLRHSEREAALIFSLLFRLNFLPLTKQLTNIAGNLWNHTLAGARAERNEYLLVHNFHARKYICPDKRPPPKRGAAAAMQLDDDDEAAGQKAGKKKGPAYTGGLVLEPKVGFYDKFVLLLDFNSLYPSIIQQFNICFTTVERARGGGAADDADEASVMPKAPDSSLEKGILPRLLEFLVQRRQMVKRELETLKASANPDRSELQQLDVRQQALKLTANSMYGCLGFVYSRFYAKPLAMLVTALGRDLLQKTVEISESKHSLQVIYGDTDSVMIYTGADNAKAVREIGFRVTKDVNMLYDKVKLGIDGMFTKMLLLKKKKYAAIKLDDERPDGTLVTHRETKGLDLVRRDWCDLAKDTSSAVLNEILGDRARDELVETVHEILRREAQQVREGNVAIEKYVINKSLTKKLEEYPDAKHQPHVQVALVR